MILSTHFVDNVFKSKLILLLNGPRYCYISLTIQLNISHVFTHS